MESINCEFCNVPIRYPRPSQRFCGDACRYAARKRERRAKALEPSAPLTAFVMGDDGDNALVEAKTEEPAFMPITDDGATEAMTNVAKLVPEAKADEPAVEEPPKPKRQRKKATNVETVVALNVREEMPVWML